jgi:AAA ATPase domain
MDAPFRPPLRGREPELAAIRGKLGQVQAGTGCVVVVEGSAGLGKTRLLDECVSMAGELSFRVGRGAAEPGRVIELGALFDALFEGDPPLADRRALDDVHASSEFLFWLLQDVQSLIEEAALKNPVLICLDDLHWGGTSLSLAMRQLPLRLSSLPVAWVMAFRPEQGLHQVQQAKMELIKAGAELIRLGPLNREAVAQVAADVLGAEADSELLQKADRVQGNPFLLVEFFRGLQDDLIVSLDSGRARLVEDRLPRRVSDSMRGRLARMSPASDRAATFASGLGRRFSIHDLAAMTGMSITELIDPVNELVQADIFADDGGQLAFRHDIIREAVRGSLWPPVRRAVDRQAADVLLARGALPVEVATQLVESAEPGDGVAIETALKATQALGASDPAAAAELAGKALDLTPLRHALRGPLVAQRVISLFAAGLAEEGKRFADSALRQAMPTEEEARVRVSVASMFDLSPEIRSGNARAGLALPSLPADLRAELWAALYHSLSVAGRKEEALAIEPSAREAAYASTSEVCRFAFELPESGLAYQLLDFGRAREILLIAERRQLNGRDDPRARLAHLLRSWILAATDQYEDALHALDAGVIAAQRDRQNWALRVFETTRGRQMLQMGNFAGRRSRLKAGSAVRRPTSSPVPSTRPRSSPSAHSRSTPQTSPARWRWPRSRRSCCRRRHPASGIMRCGTSRFSLWPGATRCRRTGGSASPGVRNGCRCSRFTRTRSRTTPNACASLRRSVTRSSQNTGSRSLNDARASIQRSFRAPRQQRMPGVSGATRRKISRARFRSTKTGLALSPMRLRWKTSAGC